MGTETTYRIMRLDIRHTLVMADFDSVDAAERYMRAMMPSAMYCVVKVTQ